MEQTLTAGQNTTKIPTLDERKQALADKFAELKDSFTQEELKEAVKKEKVTLKTGKRYVDGDIRSLERGNSLYRNLLNVLKKNIAA